MPLRHYPYTDEGAPQRRLYTFEEIIVCMCIAFELGEGRRVELDDPHLVYLVRKMREELTIRRFGGNEREVNGE